MALHEHRTLHHSTLQYSAGRCITEHITLYYGTIRYSTVQYSAVQYSAIQSSTLRYRSRITTLSRAYARSPPSPIARPRPCPCDGYARRGEARREILPCRVVVVAFVVLFVFVAFDPHLPDRAREAARRVQAEDAERRDLACAGRGREMRGVGAR